MFDLHKEDRIKAWKDFRETLETSTTPLEDVAQFWSHCPFVSHYLNPQEPESWPDPWKLVIDGRFDNLAIALGMLYTVKLTQRFIESECEIHMSMSTDKKELDYFLVVDKSYVLNFDYGKCSPISAVADGETNIIWSGRELP